ncbi:hypothetical protein [Gottfriedia acidiceleris]|uniref:hypothetical protein n=1 Tax=Gottfriedia acidiceleris TaxID=371036 RepID=UPI000B432ADA|nr:hypothetical protein [Gottfriedia acidiceleris]
MLIFLSGCTGASNEELKKSIESYLNKNYGIKEKIHIVSVENNWFEGVDYQADVKLNKPYPTYLHLSIDRDTLKVIPEDSDDIYFELFKGAYIEQNPEIIQFSNKLIKKYNLNSDKKLEKIYKDKFFLYYLNINIEQSQELKLIERFRKNNIIDTDVILPSLISSKPKINAGHIGVINSIYEYDLYGNENKVPKAETLVEEFRKSKMLKKGIYNIAVQAVNTKTDSRDENKDSNVLFSVDGNGSFLILPTPKEF